MLAPGQTFNTVTELLRTMRPGQRVLLHEVPDHYAEHGGVLAMNGRTLRNVVSKANRGRKPEKFHDYYRVLSIGRLGKLPELSVKYGSFGSISKGLSRRRSLVVHNARDGDLEVAEGGAVSYIECVRRAAEDNRESRMLDGELLTDEFFITTRMSQEYIAQGVADVAKRRVDKAVDVIKNFGITEVLATILQRLPTGRLVIGTPDKFVLPLKSRWLTAASQVFGDAACEDNWGHLRDAIAQEQPVSEWYTKHVSDIGLRWSDFGFSITRMRLGSGDSAVLIAEYTKLRAVARAAGIPLKVADEMAERLGRNKLEDEGVMARLAERVVGEVPLQPVDPVWLEGCDESLTVPLADRLQQAWDGIGVWCRVDGTLIRRAVFSMPAHENALSDADFTDEVMTDLARRGIDWPW